MLRFMPTSDESASSRKPRRPPLVLRVLLILILVYAGWCAVLYFKQDDLLFPRTLAGPGMPALPARSDLDQRWIDTGDGARVELWFFAAPQPPPSKAAQPTPKPVVMVFHGNGELIDDLLDYVDFFLALDLNVMMVEYRGYGRSGGPGTPSGHAAATPSEAALVADALKALADLDRRSGVDPAKIVLYGRSLGAGVAAQVADRVWRSSPGRPAAIILEAPFKNVTSFAVRYGVPPFLVKNPFRTDRALPPLAAAGLPVLILAAPHDEIVPISHSRQLIDRMPTARLVEVNGTHNTAALADPDAEAALHEFLRSHGIIK